MRWRLVRSLCIDAGISVHNPVASIIQEVPFLCRNAINLHNNVSLRWLCLSVPCEHKYNALRQEQVYMLAAPC